MELRGRSLGDESGQSLVEFAIVLPILLVLTFGTIQLGIFLQRQITLTGASFLAARAATVGGHDGVAFDAPAKEVLSAYGEESEQPWIKAIAEGSDGQVTVKTEETERLIRLSAFKDNKEWNEGLAAFSRMLGAGTPPKVGQMGGTIAINREYVRGNGARSAAQADSNQIVEYQADLGPALNAVSAFMAPKAQLIQSALNMVPGIPSEVKGLAGALTFEPMQAVSANPGGDVYQPGRSKAAVYASSDNETIDKTVFTKRSVFLVDTLNMGTKALALLPPLVQNPAVAPYFLPVKMGAKLAAPNADVAVRALDVIDSQVFGVTQRTR